MGASLSRGLTWAVSFLWSAASWSARRAADRGWLKRETIGARRVISVGNLQAGGGGKTPIVAQIAREAAARAISVCILTRGYGGAWERQGGVLPPLALGGREIIRAQDCGDEAALLHRLAPKAYVAVGSDRATAYTRAREIFGRDFDLVILDDGFQHWRLARDLEILALTSATPAERVFRDFPAEVARAGLVVWTKGKRAPRVYSKSLVKIQYRMSELPGTGTQVIASRDLVLLTGVADPKAVRESIELAGYRVARHTVFPDHARYDRAMALRIFEEVRDAGFTLAMTGKDWVKWLDFGIPAERVRVFEPALDWLEGGELWSQMLWGT